MLKILMYAKINKCGTYLVTIINFHNLFHNLFLLRCGGLVVCMLVSGSSGPGLRANQGHCVVFLGETLFSHNASLHPGV